MDNLIGIIEPLLRFFLVAALIFVLFFCLVRPFLNYLLINKEIEQKKRIIAEVKEMNSVVESPADDSDYDEDTVDHLPASKQEKATPDKEALAKLAESDPEKAGDLVKNWIHSD